MSNHEVEHEALPDKGIPLPQPDPGEAQDAMNDDGLEEVDDDSA